MVSRHVQLQTNYHQIRHLTESLCQPLQKEDYVVQPIEDVSPPKWHLGHTTWFFENFILARYLPAYTPFNPKFNYFFNSYYESQGPRVVRSKRGNMSRPGVDQVYSYRRYVDEHMASLLEKQKKGLVPDPTFDMTLEIGLQHEQQHQELLLTDIKFIFGNNPLFPPYIPLENPEGGPPVPYTWLKVEAGLYTIGFDGEGFAWDNEKSAHQVYLQDFQVMDRLVTNGEYIEFIEAGGYFDYQWWLSEGWEWAKRLEEKAPLYWFKQEDGWYHYTLRGLEKVNPSEPVVHVSYFEADAFAQWKGLRLPTEAEWEVACQIYQPALTAHANFVERGLLHPAPAKDYQFLGDVWEWTGSAYLPYPNYPRFEGALGEYNGKFMINQMVLRGGSVATPQNHIRRTYRNFFQTDKRWQFTGFRLAK